MDFTFKIEVHIYAREELHDELLDDNNPVYGIMGKDIMMPLRENRKCVFELECTKNTNLKDISDLIINKVNHNRLFTVGTIAFLANGYRYYIDDESAKFITIARKYLNPLNENEIDVEVLVCADAGSICQDDGIRYYMHSHEGTRHNEPHVHIDALNHGCDASFSIITGEILEGKLPKKLLKKVKNKILKEQNFFVECWNTKTDGLAIDINKHFGITNY